MFSVAYNSRYLFFSLTGLQIRWGLADLDLVCQCLAGRGFRSSSVSHHMSSPFWDKPPAWGTFFPWWMAEIQETWVEIFQVLNSGLSRPPLLTSHEPKHATCYVQQSRKIHITVVGGFAESHGDSLGRIEKNDSNYHDEGLGDRKQIYIKYMKQVNGIENEKKE